MVESQMVRIYSVKLDHRSNRVFLLKDNANVVCHHENCKESRAVHMASAVQFSSAHIAATENSSAPLSAKVLSPEDIQGYKCEGKDVTFLTGRQPREFQVSFGRAKIFLTRFRNDSYNRVRNFSQFRRSLLKRCVETLHRRLKTL